MRKLLGLLLVGFFLTTITEAVSGLETKGDLVSQIESGGEDTNSRLSVEDVLPGTWNYISSSTTKDGPFESIEPTKIYWTLNEDGTGVYYRKINQFNAASIHDDLRWKVKGKTLTMDGDIHYTIMAWGESWMVWRNPSGSTYLRVHKE